MGGACPRARRSRDPGDANGNLTGDGTWTYAYDAQNMMRTTTKSGAAVSYVYDPVGRRQAITENGVVTTFLFGGGNHRHHRD